MSIFVSIASYRDPELTNTISDCLARARFPDELRFGICWQHDAEDDSLRGPTDSRFRIIDCDWRASRGACWARAEIMKLWDGEDYFLQIDSHHRFAQNWDERLIDIASRTGSLKPLLTTYCPAYTPGDTPDYQAEPTQMDFDYFAEGGIPLFRGGENRRFRETRRALRARFVSGHFLFTIGSFAREVPYDPDLYFHGEEIMLAVRAYTWGYDLFHPPEALLWHEYTREYRRKHWDDHEEGPVEVAWYARDEVSMRKVSQFLREPFVGTFGCGPMRRFSEYEEYAGINFQHSRVQDYALKGGEPPNPPAASNWYEEPRPWKVNIDLDISQLQPTAIMDAEFWYVGFHDADGNEVYREDASHEELTKSPTNGGQRILIERKFESVLTPKTWTVWPVSRSNGWLDKVEGLVSEK